VLRHQRRGREALRIYPDSAAASAIGDAVSTNTATTAASFTDDDPAASDAVADTGGSEAQAFPNAWSDCNVDAASRGQRRNNASSDSETAGQNNADTFART